MYNLINDIKENAITHGSLPFWSWNDKLNETELRRQINKMHELGMNGFFMHARSGLETEYLSEDWYNCINACIDEAKKLGMQAWSYDENGWPSGFAGGKLLEDKANHAVWLKYEKTNAFPKETINSSENDILGIYIIEENTLKKVVSPVENAEYHIVYKKYDPTYVDTMDAEITQKFINATYEDYKLKVPAEDFGTVMPGFFTDEPQYFRWHTPYSDKMPNEFFKRWGYDVTCALPALFCDFDKIEGFDFGADGFRHDYFRLCHDLFINNFIKVIYDWCEANNCKITGHAVEESFLSGQMWCCGGVMPFYEYEHIPGIDYLGRNISSDISPKQIGSACAQLGKKYVISEMFACCGWDVTPTELKKIAELQYAGGVNMMCQHLYPYSERGQRKRDYPAHFSEHLPWQNKTGDFNNYFNNLGYTLSLGSEYANTLLIHPIHSAYTKYKREMDGRSIADLEKKTVEISNLFSQNQIPYHWGDEVLMEKYASVENDKIKVGLVTYDFIVIPYIYTLDSSTAELLKKYIANGGKVWIYSDKPTMINGKISDMSWLESNIDFADIKASSDLSLSCGEKNIPELRMQTRITENGRIIYITNLSDKIISDINLNIKNCCGVYNLDMNDLSCGGVMYTKNNNSLNASFTLEGAQSVVFVENCNSEIKTEDKQITKSIVLNNNFVFKTKPQNMMILDYAYLSYDNIEYSPIYSLYAIKDMLLKERYKGNVYIKFPFEVEKIPENLSFAAELLDYFSISVNGKEVKLSDEWWFDYSFKSVNISEYVKIGTNEITFGINYFQSDYVYYVLYGGVTESLRNCLNFDTEIECIYLFGNFNIITDKTKFTPSERCSEIYEGKFIITEQKNEIDITDIVRDGYPFFGGAIDVMAEYNYDENSGSELYIKGRYAVCDVYVNGTFVKTLMFTNHVDLSKYLKIGINTIELKLYNSNRNLLGPHHRNDPEPWGVGPNTFSFENEWNDWKCRGYLDRYSFVRFGIDL